MSEIIETDRNGASPTGSAIVYNIPDLKAMAAKILRRANEVAQQTIATAKQSVAEQEKAAHAEGEKRGYADGVKRGEMEGRAAGEKAARQEFAEHTGTLVQALSAALEGMNQRKLSLQAEAEADLLRLAMEIARRVVRREVQLDENFILPIVREAIALTNNRSDLLIWVNPADYAAVERELPGLEAVFSDLGRAELREDAKIERGGVRVLNREGEVDMRLHQQLSALERALVGDTQGLCLDLNNHLAKNAAISPEAHKRPELVVDEASASVTEGDGVTPAPEDVSRPLELPERAIAAPLPQEGGETLTPIKPESSSVNAAESSPGSEAEPEGFTPGIGALEDNTFHPGVTSERAGTSTLSGLGSLRDIPADSRQEELIEAALREGLAR